MRKFISSLVLLLAIVISGCITVQPVNAPNDGAANRTSLDDVDLEALGNENLGHELAPGDPIYVRFSGVMDQQMLELVVDENGHISLLHINEPILAAGLSPSELEDKIEKLYVDGGIYRHISVNITMTAKVFYVQGEVLAPGQFQLMSGTTLLQAIAGARGYSPYADKKKVTIMRQGRVEGVYNTKAIEKNPSLDVKIEAGDVIKVPQTWY